MSSHLLLQNYLLERLLFRISLSDYKENIILKGGLLIASLIGVDRRTTMDMDTAIKSYPVNEKQIVAMLLEILSIEANDGVSFEFLDIKVIRQKDEYNGYRARIISKLGKISQNLSIDISTGDVITPGQIAYAYKTLIDDMTKTLDELIAPRILMNRDKPKAVLISYELFKSMELALENQTDEILVKTAEKRLSDSKSKNINHEEFWLNMEGE